MFIKNVYEKKSIKSSRMVFYICTFKSLITFLGASRAIPC